MSANLERFRSDYLQATTCAQRKDGEPFYLLDALSPEEPLHALLEKTASTAKIEVAHAIYQINGDSQMIEILC